MVFIQICASGFKGMSGCRCCFYTYKSHPLCKATSGSRLSSYKTRRDLFVSRSRGIKSIFAAPTDFAESSSTSVAVAFSFRVEMVHCEMRLWIPSPANSDGDKVDIRGSPGRDRLGAALHDSSQSVIFRLIVQPAYIKHWTSNSCRDCSVGFMRMNGGGYIPRDENGFFATSRDLII